MRTMLLSAWLGLGLVPAPAVQAQERGPLIIPAREPAEVMLLRLSASSRCQEDCTVRGAPYSADRVVESVQVLADGNRIVERSSAQMYRDEDGRTRVESEWQDKPLVQIQDPVRNMSYRLYPSEKTGIRMAIGAPAAQPARAASTLPLPAANGVSPGAARIAGQLAPVLDGAGASMGTQRVERSLGTRQIEGLTVEGRLVTTTIPAGRDGNLRPLVMTEETWRSPALKLNIYVKSTNPRYGERVLRLQNIGRTAPPDALFSVPADYTVREIARQ